MGWPLGKGSFGGLVLLRNILDEHKWTQGTQGSLPAETDRQQRGLLQVGPAGEVQPPPQDVTVCPGSRKIAKTGIIPTFNNDRRHYTHSFQIPAQIQEPDQMLQSEHERRVEEAGRELSEMVDSVLAS